jgi:hypothetical protein
MDNLIETGGRDAMFPQIAVDANGSTLAVWA